MRVPRCQVLLASLAAAVLLPWSAVSPATAAPAAPAAAPCFDTSTPQTVEQARLSRPAPRAILRRSGAADRVSRFATALCRADSRREARGVVERHGHGLWEWATGRAQGRIRVAGDLPGGDDRPLYWARVAMTRVLARWQGDAAGLLGLLETTSRGQDTVDFGRATRRVLVTGFDPFTLDVDTRIGNPSGAAALAFDGRWVSTAAGPARVETAMFPVRWDDFRGGEVERTLSPFIRRGGGALAALVTVSQGRPDQFDLEVWNGARRGGFADNANRERTGTIPIPRGFPTVRPQPQFTRTSLPLVAMRDGGTGDYPVLINREITERNPATDEVRTHTDGPTPGWVAVSGGPGDYLSNEIAYRATLLRDAIGAHHPGGHVHTPVLGLPGGDALTGPGYEGRRDAIVAQTRALVRLAVRG